MKKHIYSLITLMALMGLLPSMVLADGVVLGTVNLNDEPIVAEYYTIGTNARLGSGYNACIPHYSTGKVVVPASITVNGATYNVTEVSDMAFRLCSYVTEVVLPVGVTRIGNFAFLGCKDLTRVDLPSTLTTIGRGAFIDLPYLARIDIHATTPPTWEYNDVFRFHPEGIGDSHIYHTRETMLCIPESIEPSVYTSANFTNPAIGWTTPDGWGYFIHTNISADENAEAYTVYKDGTLTFYYDGNKSIREGTKYQLNTGEHFPGWTDDTGGAFPTSSPDPENHSADITRVVFAPSFYNARPVSTSKWFCDCVNLDTIIGWEYLNTSEATNMGYMFSNCSKLTDYDLDFSNFVTSNVEAMMNMFENCTGLTQIDLSGFDTRNCNNLGYMFNGCSGLTSLDVSSFRTENCNYFNEMFHGCSNLEELNIAPFDMSNQMTHCSKMFMNCSKLKTLFIPVALNEGEDAFIGCTSVEDAYCYRHEPFTNWVLGAEAFAPNKATRFHVLASAYDVWITKYGPTSDIPANVTFVGDLGTDNNPVLLYSAADWINLSGLANKNLDINAKMMNDFEITTMLGTDDHPFKGVFDGNGHTLTANIVLGVPSDGNAFAPGPFRRIRNANIRNLHIDGKISTNTNSSENWFFPGGLVGDCLGSGNIVINNCRISTEITGKFVCLGGIVGYTDYSARVVMVGCLFDGKLSPSLDIYTSYLAYAGFISFGDYAWTSVYDCVAKGTTENLDTDHLAFCRDLNGIPGLITLNSHYGGLSESFDLENCYHFHPDLNLTAPKYAYSITCDTEGLNLDFGTPGATYDVSGITGYRPGIIMDETFWASNDQTIPITLSAPGYNYNINNVQYTGNCTHEILGENSISVKPNNANVVITLPMTFTTIILHEDAVDNTHVLDNYVDQTYNVELNGHTIYNRDSWNALCLPFDLAEYQLHNSFLHYAKLKMLDTITFSNNVVVYHFKDTTAIAANKPYLVKLDGNQDIVSPTFNNVTIKRSLPPGMKMELEEFASRGYALLGNYNAIQGNGDDNVTRLYLNRNNRLVAFDHTTEFGAFHAYLELVDVPLHEMNAIVLEIEGEDDIFYADVVCDAVFYKEGNWNDEGNWTKYNPNTLSHSSVYIVADAHIPSGCEAEVNLFVVADEAKLTVKDGGQLIYHESYYYDDYPEVTVEKNIARYNSDNDGWNLIASPIIEDLVSAEVKGLVPISDTTYDLYYFKEENMKWINYKQHYGNEDPGFGIHRTKGYLYANIEGTTIKFTGHILPYVEYNPDVEVNLSHVDQGWNLVGNPFTYNAYANKPYFVINGRTVEAYEGSAPIPPCTGIIVKAEGTGSESVTFTKANSVTSNGNQGSLRIALVENTTRGNALLDNAVVSFNEGSALPKFNFGTQNANIYIPQGGKDYAIAFSEGQGEMPLNFIATKDGQYTISVNPEGVELSYLHLIDNLTGNDIDLLPLCKGGQGGFNEPVYTFTAKTTDYESRFKLVFATVCGDADGDSDSFAFISNGNIIVNGEGTLQVLDVTGRIVLSTDVARNVSTSGMTPGVYVLRLMNGSDVKVQKIIVR